MTPPCYLLNSTHALWLACLHTLINNLINKMHKATEFNCGRKGRNKMVRSRKSKEHLVGWFRIGAIRRHTSIHTLTKEHIDTHRQRYTDIDIHIDTHIDT